MDAVSVKSRPSPDGRCAFCHDDLDEESAVCPDCKTVLHRDCRALLVECPTLGCRQSIFTLLSGQTGARRVRVRPAFRRALASLAAREGRAVGEVSRLTEARREAGWPLHHARLDRVVALPIAIGVVLALILFLVAVLLVLVVPVPEYVVGLVDAVMPVPILLGAALRQPWVEAQIFADAIVLETGSDEKVLSPEELLGYDDSWSGHVSVVTRGLLARPLRIPTPTERDRAELLDALDILGLRRLGD